MVEGNPSDLVPASVLFRLGPRTSNPILFEDIGPPIQVENKRGGCTTRVAAAPPDPIQVEDKRGGCTISVAAALPNLIQVEDKRGGCAHSG